MNSVLLCFTCAMLNLYFECRWWWWWWKFLCGLWCLFLISSLFIMFLSKSNVDDERRATIHSLNIEKSCHWNLSVVSLISSFKIIHWNDKRFLHRSSVWWMIFYISMEHFPSSFHNFCSFIFASSSLNSEFAEPLSFSSNHHRWMSMLLKGFWNFLYHHEKALDSRFSTSWTAEKWQKVIVSD